MPLAVAYQLMSPQTNCILVHARAEADKATAQAELQQVSSMLAAGWGATGTVLESALPSAPSQMPTNYYEISLPSNAPLERSDAGIRACVLASSEPDATPPLDKQPAREKLASLEPILRAVLTHLGRTGQMQGLAAHCDTLAVDPDVREALDQTIAEGFAADLAWVLLAFWISQENGGDSHLSNAAVLKPHFARRRFATVAPCFNRFDRLLDNPPNAALKTSRSQRIQSALNRSLS